MSNKNLYRLDKKDQSQLDPGGVLKSAHDDLSQSIRTVNGITSVPSSYSRVALTYNSEGSVTKAVFYEGTAAQKVELITVNDVLGSLNNTYFQIYSENDESLYHIWFNVGGLGTDPAPTGSCGVEVPIQGNDSSLVVAKAIQIAMRHLPEFKLTVLNSKIIIENTRKGAASLPVDMGTGFALTTIDIGSERLLKCIDIPFDGNSKYLYNTQDKHFEVRAVSDAEVEINADDGDNIAVSGHQNPRIFLEERDIAAAGLDETLYTQISAFTMTEDVRIRKIEIKADTFGTFELRIDNVLRHVVGTSPLERNAIFSFLEEERPTTGQVVEVKFRPDRIIRVATYNFFTRVEGYLP
jgi:hypothetical protein